MLTLTDDLGRLASRALSAAFPQGTVPDVVAFVRSDKADVQTAAAMQLAKGLGQKPRDIAGVVASAVEGHEAVASVEIAGPGFVNVSLRNEYLQAHARDALTLRPMGAGQRVVLDFSSPNVAKPMHIAHIRSTIIGESIKRALRAVGYDVVADNHLGDWGTQFGKLIVAYRTWLDQKAYEESAVNELLRLYVKFVDEEKKQRAPKTEAGAAQGAQAPAAESDEDDGAQEVTPLLKAARAELVKLQQGDPENVALWKQFVDVSIKEFDRVYKRLDVSFDVTLGESFYNDRLAPTVDAMMQKGIAEESDGAIVVRFSKEQDGEALPPFLVRKADGGFLYGSTDVAGLLYRMERWSPSRIVIVTDERQQLHFRQLFATGRRLGVKASLEHVWFGLMRLPEGTISTRDGNLIGLEALLDEAERRAKDLARQCNPELSESELDEVARVVGIGAVKYNDLSKDRQTLVTFTWDKALALTGNTAPYLQYAYARIRSMLRKAEAEGFAPGPVRITEATERALVLRALGFDEAVEEVAKTARPHVLCEYLFNLATAFSTFYNELPVLKAEPEVRASRLALSALVAETLKKGLEILGIGVLERM